MADRYGVVVDAQNTPDLSALLAAGINPMFVYTDPLLQQALGRASAAGLRPGIMLPSWEQSPEQYAANVASMSSSCFV